MKALVKRGSGDMGIENIAEPTPQKHEIKIKVLAAGICGTDIHIMKDEYPYNAPVVMGHEYVGVIDEVGAEVEHFKRGDSVVSLTAVKTCGKCRYCREGALMLCPERLSIGSGVNGAFAEYLTVPARLAYRVPAGVVSVEDLAITEPFACAVRAVVERSSVTAGDLVLISGPGTIGLLALQLAKIQGGYVIVVGTSEDEKRLDLAKKLGADLVLSEPDDLNRLVNEITPDGVDVAFECAGVEASGEKCLQVLRKQGIFSQVGLYGRKIAINLDQFLYKEITVTTNFASEPTSWDKALRLIKNNQVNLHSLISARIPLEEWKKGFDLFFDKSNLKIFLVP